MNLRNALLTLHILTAILLIGWLAMQSMLVPRVIRQGPDGLAAVRFSHRTSGLLGRLAPIVFLLGLWLVFRDDDGIDISDAWVSWSMLLFIVALVNGAVLIARAEGRAVERFERGEPAPEEAKRVAMLGGINNVILLVIVYLMVAKPGGF